MPDTTVRLPAIPIRHASRGQLYIAIVDAWLDATGAPMAQREALWRDLAPALDAWLADPGAQHGTGLIDRLAAFVASQSALSPWRAHGTHAVLATAVARGVLAQATADVQMEAARAGHLDAFRAFRPWLGRPLPVAEAQRLAAARGLGAVALERALGRLRRRWRQRIDAALALCSGDGEPLDALRAQLHAVLVHGETQP